MVAVDLKRLITSWERAIDAAAKARQDWQDTADQCKHFYSGSMGFMFQGSFKNRYLKNLPETKFEFTIAKAFELVSIVGPTLFWNYPGRIVTDVERLDVPPGFWQDPTMAEAWSREYEHDRAVSKTRNEIMQLYLNYAQREQPGGGLFVDSHMAIIDSLVSGRGVLRVDPYETMGGQGKLTGAFRVDPYDLYIDPDCRRSNLSDAKWIAIRHVDSHYDLEKRFGWPEGSLKKYATRVSRQSAAGGQALSPDWNVQSQTTDQVVWFEVFSKFGCGQNFRDMGTSEWKGAFDQIGNYTYMCFTKGMTEFLNVRSSFLETADMDKARQAFDWPTRYYEDNRWPLALLDYWLRTDSPWPMAHLAMGLSELTFMNVFISCLADKIFLDSLSKSAVRTEIADEAVAKLLSYKHEVIRMNPSLEGDINKYVSYLQRPQTSFDAFRMLEYISSLFDKRTGLTELLYGLNPGGKVSRTAEDAKQKGDAVNTRPEYMLNRVESWQSEVANLDRICAAEHVVSPTITPLLGRMGASLWDDLITNEDPSVYMRQMRCRVEANSIRKPNKARDSQNMQQLGGYVFPVLQWYAQTTGDTNPLNAFIHDLGKGVDQDTTGWMLPPIPQQGPSPEQQAMEQLNQAKMEQDVQGRVLKNQKMAHEAILQGQGISMEQLLQQATPGDA